MNPPQRDDLRQRAESIRQACASGTYCRTDGTTVDFNRQLTQALASTRLITPADWSEIESRGHARCASSPVPGHLSVTTETSLACARRLVSTEGRTQVAVLNFASARNPGGGWDRGAVAQEESLARATALVPCLIRCPAYYEANRRQESLLYTDHAIWSPDVPVLADDTGRWEDAPYTIGIITMPAPNAGPMRSERDLQSVVPTFRSRIRKVLALAADAGVEHLVLGAWGCGAFGNHPEVVAPLFAEALQRGTEPWRNGFASISFAIHDSSREQRSTVAFQQAFSAP